MATTTPSTSRQVREFDTIQRSRFFDAFDSRQNDTGIARICKTLDFDLPPSTARYWVKQRDSLGSIATRRTRKLSSRLGRPTKISAEGLVKLTDPEETIREMPPQNQVNLFPTEPSTRTLRRQAAQEGAHRYKKPYNTEISPANKAKRVEYSQKYENETLTDF